MHQKKDNTYTGNWDDLNLITLKNKTRQREKKKWEKENNQKKQQKKHNKHNTVKANNATEIMNSCTLLLHD